MHPGRVRLQGMDSISSARKPSYLSRLTLAGSGLAGQSIRKKFFKLNNSEERKAKGQARRKITLISCFGEISVGDLGGRN
ncbi:hypothetical protein L6452_31069 [Arctium lappa]|uniref:Uncharacterized protein n=1 Tax=Arctium lappa TaxID=4217 RepID=A0ACB8ZK88_ARCLA|nr:hypothetical protein L6452_31069 [Arctium lappa]